MILTLNVVIYQTLEDHIAIPNFVSGAMEHWGIITYRETALLYDDVESSAVNKQRVAQVVSHEIAHMVSGKCKQEQRENTGERD